MNQVSVTINGKDLHMVFNLRTLRAVGRALQLQSLEEVSGKIAQLATLHENTPFDLLEFLWMLIYQAVVNVEGQEKVITLREIEDLNIADLQLIAEQMAVGIQSAFPAAAQDHDQESESVEDSEKK